MLCDLRHKRTILLCTHDLAEARELTSRVAILHDGRLVAAGKTRDVLGGEDPLGLFRTREGRAAAPADPPKAEDAEP